MDASDWDDIYSPRRQHAIALPMSQSMSALSDVDDSDWKDVHSNSPSSAPRDEAPTVRFDRASRCYESMSQCNANAAAAPMAEDVNALSGAESDWEDVYSTSPPSESRDQAPTSQAGSVVRRGEDMSQYRADTEAPIKSEPPVNTSCPLLELAAELRNRIYEYAVIEENTIEILPMQRQFPLRTLQPALTRVNRQLRQEVLPMFYSQNTFEIKAVLSTSCLDSFEPYHYEKRSGNGYPKIAELCLLNAHTEWEQLIEILEYTRSWLTAVGRENQKRIREIIVAHQGPVTINSSKHGIVRADCLRVLKLLASMRIDDLDQVVETWLKQLASTRFDRRSERIVKTDAEPLVEGWSWSDDKVDQVKCDCSDLKWPQDQSPPIQQAGPMTHCKLVFNA